MPLLQPPVEPLPGGIDLTGQTAIVTGATSGVGLALCHELLALKVSTLILAVRNVSKGETVKSSLQADPHVVPANPHARIEVMKLDTEDYDSVKAFATAFVAKFSELHILMLNAGIGTFKKELAEKTGHEKNMQVNYLSNILLTLELLPVMETTAEKMRRPTRITWTGSRSYKDTSLVGDPLLQGKSLLRHLTESEKVTVFSRYGNSKFLSVVFQRELAKHYTGDKVIMNAFCPGMTDTAMGDVLPCYLRVVQKAIFAVRARTPQQGAWIGLNAALVAGADSHGKLLVDKKLDEYVEHPVIVSFYVILTARSGRLGSSSQKRARAFKS